MPRYTFTHPFAEVFADLTHGAGTVVHRAVEADDPLGSTVVLYPGDELTTKKKYVHAHLTTDVPDDSNDSSDELSDEVPAETATDPEVKE